MAAKKQQLRVSTRSLPKHLAGRLQDRVLKMRDDPTVLLPTCVHEGGCAMGSLERRLRRVQKAAESRTRLRRLSRRGTPLARAYAGALDLLFADSVPMLAGFPSPFGGGEVKYAQRGNAKKEVQAGVQNFSDKGVRMLAFLPYAKGFRGVYLFSTDDGVLCAGRSPVPPEVFLEECAASQRPALVRAGDDFVCPHLKTRGAGLPRGSDETHLAARWARSKGALRVCGTCAGSGNLSTTLRKYALGPKFNEQVESWVELRPRCREAGSDSCHFDRRFDLEEDEAAEFGKGTSADGEVLAGVLKRAMGEVESQGEGFVLAGGACHGRDVATILDELSPDPEMRRALEAALGGNRKDIVLDSLTSSKLLSKSWKECGAEILGAACGSAAVGARVFKEAKANEAPASLVQRAVKLARDAAVEEALPAFEGLSVEAALADRVARGYRRGGAEGALREIEAGRTLSPSAGAVAWAFLAALEKAGGREWQFTNVEIARGANARVDARALLDCRADDYAGKLRSALAALGIHEAVEPTTT